MKNLRRTLIALSVMLVCLLAVPSEKADAAAKLSKTKATVYVGNTTNLTVKGTKKKVTWTTSNSKVATVKSGKVTAKKQGTAVITAKVGSKKYTCKVTVKNLSMSGTRVNVNKGKVTKLRLNGAFKTVTFKSSNTKVAKVSKYGNVRALQAGVTTITARHNGKNYTCRVIVRDNNISILKFDRMLLEDIMEPSEVNKFFKQLDVKTKTIEEEYVYYAVTKKSQQNLLANIKKSLNEDIAVFVKGQEMFKKITFNSNCTQVNYYLAVNIFDFDAMDDIKEPSDEVMEKLESIISGFMYYQLFSGKQLETMNITTNYYDYASNKLILSIPMI